MGGGQKAVISNLEHDRIKTSTFFKLIIGKYIPKDTDTQGRTAFNKFLDFKRYYKQAELL